MLTTYEPSMSMLEARARYFAVNGFGETGGYDDPWVDFKLGPVPFPFPNTRGRVRAVQIHDLHHIVTGYDTDTLGEFEISAWELGAGCRDFYAAWQLNLGGLGAGLVSAPGRTYRAFVRGRHSTSLYSQDVGGLLHRSVREVREASGADLAASARATAADKAWFALASLAGVLTMVLFAVLFIPLVPFGLAAHHLRRRAVRRAAASV